MLCLTTELMILISAHLLEPGQGAVYRVWVAIRGSVALFFSLSLEMR